MTGLLWLDANPERSLQEKVRAAGRRYRKKFGLSATVCHLNARDHDGKTERVGQIRLKVRTNVQRHHYLVGRDGNGTRP